MPESIGSMEVTYSVTVSQALKNLDKLNNKMDETTEKTETQTEADKAKKVSLNQAAKAWAVMGAVATSALYGIIKASSYAAIYTTQFGAIVQQLANVFMEETGINKAIEDFLRAFQLFTDRIENGDTIVQSFTKSLITFGEWFSEQTGLIQFLTLLGGLIIVVGLVIGVLGALGIAGAAISSGWAVLAGIAAFLVAKFVLVKLAIAKVITWFAAGSTAAIALAVAIGALIGLIGVWLLQKTGILDWFATLGEKFREWDSWIKDIILIIASPMALLGAAIIDIVNGDFGFPLLISGLESVWDTIGRLIDKVKDLINWIAKIPSTFGFGGGGSGSGGMGTSISQGSMPGGGDYNDVVIAPGGRVITTHPQDFLIATKNPGELMDNSGKSGGDVYNIAPIINITTAGGSGMAADISRQVSKEIASEIRRITKV